jgi:hypothetical protein
LKDSKKEAGLPVSFHIQVILSRCGGSFIAGMEMGRCITVALNAVIKTTK